MLFPTSVIGSLPRPQFVRDLITMGGVVDPEQCGREMNVAISYAVAMQEHAGLDVITDGEWRRASYIGVIAELAHGFTLSRSKDGRPWTIVVDELSPKESGFIANEVKFLKRITEKRIKATLPSPSLLGERMWDPERSTRAYPDRRDFVRACVPILQRELLLLQQEGADIVQIDDPYLCLFVDPIVRSQYADPDEEAAFDVEMINQLVDGVHGLKVAVHLCRRAGARVRGERKHTGSFAPIIAHLNQLHVQHLTLEFTAPGVGDVSVLKDLRQDFEIGLGCVSVHPGEVDSPETIVDRVEQALRVVTPDRITLNPDCGFAPGSAAEVSLDEVYQKLRNEVQAARILRERYGFHE